jgi:hypothetical protein
MALAWWKRQEKAKKEVDTASYKIYYVNYEIGAVWGALGLGPV